MANKASIFAQLWRQLEGTWQFTRKLHSSNAAEPSGNCTGTATLVSQQPNPFVDAEGVFQNASQEMLYSEQGHFEMTTADDTVNPPQMPFSRKYVWRLQGNTTANPEISIWFVKPGTEQIDYLFHKVLFQHVTDSTREGSEWSIVECIGGHLCVDDYYTSTYTFGLEHQDDGTGDLRQWTMLHEVVGPRKDQIIETEFTKK